MSSKNTEIGVFIIVTTGLILLLIGFIILILFLYKRKQLNFYRNLEVVKHDHEKNLLNARLEIKEDTLKHISTEIHDNIGLALTLGKFYLNTINWADPTDIPQKVSGSIEQITKAIDALDHLSKTLNNDYIAEYGLLKALHLETAYITQLKLHTTSLEITGTPVFMDTQTEVVIFRIVQEALNNSIKHAKANSLSIAITYTPSDLHVQVADNGTGIEETPGAEEKRNGSGLRNMQYRATLLNGTFSIGNNHPQGTLVQITIPITATTKL